MTSHIKQVEIHIYCVLTANNKHLLWDGISWKDERGQTRNLKLHSSGEIYMLAKAGLSVHTSVTAKKTSLPTER